MLLDAAGFTAPDLQALRDLLPELGARLGVKLDLAPGGEVLLLEMSRSLDLPASTLHVMRAGRPTALVVGAALRHPAAALRERESLLRQLADLPELRSLGAANDGPPAQA